MPSFHFLDADDADNADKGMCQNTDGLCHSERSEESVNISRNIKHTLSDSSLRSE